MNTIKNAKLEKVNDGKPNQIAYSFNLAKKFLEKYIVMDLTKDETWERIVEESNTIYEYVKKDYLTNELVLTSINYLDELRKLKVDNFPAKEDVSAGGFQVQGFQVQGFQVKDG